MTASEASWTFALFDLMRSPTHPAFNQPFGFRLLPSSQYFTATENGVSEPSAEASNELERFGVSALIDDVVLASEQAICRLTEHGPELVLGLADLMKPARIKEPPSIDELEAADLSESEAIALFEKSIGLKRELFTAIVPNYRLTPTGFLKSAWKLPNRLGIP